MILEERGRPLVRNRRRDKNGGVCLARPVRVVDMLSRCIRRHSTRDEKITATLHASSTSSGVEAKQSCPADSGLWGRQGPCRRRPRSAILFRSRARGCSEGISWQPTRAIVVGAGQLAMDLGVCETAQWCCCSSGDGGFSLSFRHFFLQRDGRRLTRGHGGEREEQTQQSSGQGPRAKREGPDVGVVDPTISPSPEIPGSARLDLGGHLLSRPIDSGPNANNATSLALFDDNDTTLLEGKSWNCATTKSPCYRATLSTLCCTSQVPKLAEIDPSHGPYPHLEACRLALSIVAAQHM